MQIKKTENRTKGSEKFRVDATYREKCRKEWENIIFNGHIFIKIQLILIKLLETNDSYDIFPVYVKE